MRQTANNLAVLRNAGRSRMTMNPSHSRLLTTLVVGAGLLAVALLATRSAAAEKVALATTATVTAADVRHEELTALVAQKQAAAQKVLDASKLLTGKAAQTPAVEEGEAVPASAKIAAGGELLRPAAKAAPATRTMKMVVTAYCPCKKCCGQNAQGITASGKPVSHNKGRFVAADTSVLAFGKKLVIPGYHDGTPVEVLDTGSAIKGKRLDVYFSSHQKALEWGRRTVDVTVID